MLKHIALGVLVSFSLLAAGSANAAFSAADCNYARAVLGQDAGSHSIGGTHFDASAQVVQQCAEKGM